MNFDLTDEQQQLRDAVDRFVRGSYGFELRKRVLKSADGFDAKVWSGLAELGLLGLLAPEAHGGLALGPIETALAMQAAGPALLVEPWLDVAVTATVLLNASGDDAASAALLPAIASGERLVVVAHQEAAGRGEVAFVETRAQPKGGDFVLSGRKAVVPGAGVAHEWLVSARESGDAIATSGVSVSAWRAAHPACTCAHAPPSTAAAPPSSRSPTRRCLHRRASVRRAARCRRSSAPATSRWRRSVPKRWASCRPRSTRRWST
jgi:alkylation response protein AidB-like acyl-CoA dehydrogenase